MLDVSVILAFLLGIILLHTFTPAVLTCCALYNCRQCFPESGDYSGFYHRKITSLDYQYPASDLLPRVANLCHKEWQESWNAETNNEVFEIKPVIGKERHRHWLYRQENTSINDFVLGIHASHTSIYCWVTVVQFATNATVSLQLSMSYWTATLSITFVESILPAVPSLNCLKTLNLIKSSILSKKSIFTISYNRLFLFLC